MSIRNACKAIIIEGERVLLNKNCNTLLDMFPEFPDGGIYYDLPGGGQTQYETLEEAVVREVLEETGHTVAVERLAGVYEEITLNPRFRAQYPDYSHKIFFVFVCRLARAAVVAPTEIDLDMVGCEWVDIGAVKDLLFYPDILQSAFDDILASDKPLYLGNRCV